MDENNLNGFDSVDDDYGTTVLTSPGVNAYNPGGPQPTNGQKGMSPQPGMPQPMNGQMGMPPQPGMPQSMNGQMGMPPQPGMPQPTNGQMGMPSQPGMPQSMNGQMGMSPQADDEDYGTTVLTSPGVNAYNPGSAQPMNGQPGMQPQPMGGQPGMQPQPMGGQPGMQSQTMGGQPGMQQPMNGQQGMQPGGMYGRPGMQPGGMYGQPGMQPGGMYGQPGMPPQMPGSKPKDKKPLNVKLIVGIACGVLAIIVLIFGVKALLGGSGYKDIKDMDDDVAEALKNTDEDAIVDMMGEDIYEIFLSEEALVDSAARESAHDTLEYDKKEMEREVGDLKSITITETDIEYEDEEEVKQTTEYIRNLYNTDLELEGMAEIESDVDIEGKDGTATGSIYIDVVKIDGKWYLLAYYFYLD